SNGKNTPKEKYVIPEQYSSEIKERALRDFEELIRFASSFADVKFITGTDAPKVYSRNPERELSLSEIREIATKIANSNKISFFKLADEYISPSQAFCALVNFLAGYSKSKELPERTAMSEPLGPMAPFKSKAKSSKLPLTRLLAACGQASKFIADKGCMPSSLKIGAIAEFAPSDFLATIAAVVKSLASEKKAVSETVPLRRARMILEEKYVDEKAFKTACAWGILPKGFKAPKILEQAKLQTWTLVPAESRN
ncbi:MAG TPA: hypothetical protein VED17_08605, partial [Nitrososphaerales archaeon]|nr:hypothetical protein [Nitrososphaerales archaeon]